MWSRWVGSTSWLVDGTGIQAKLLRLAVLDSQAPGKHRSGVEGCAVWSPLVRRMERSDGRVGDPCCEMSARSPFSPHASPLLLAPGASSLSFSVGFLLSCAAGGEDLWLCATTSKESKVDQGMEFQ